MFTAYLLIPTATWSAGLYVSSFIPLEGRRMKPDMVDLCLSYHPLSLTLGLGGFRGAQPDNLTTPKQVSPSAKVSSTCFYFIDLPPRTIFQTLQVSEHNAERDSRPLGMSKKFPNRLIHSVLVPFRKAIIGRCYDHRCIRAASIASKLHTGLSSSRFSCTP